MVVYLPEKKAFMIDDYLLGALVAFAKYGTLSATADHLMVT